MSLFNNKILHSALKLHWECFSLNAWKETDYSLPGDLQFRHCKLERVDAFFVLEMAISV